LQVSKFHTFTKFWSSIPCGLRKGNCRTLL